MSVITDPSPTPPAIDLVAFANGLKRSPFAFISGMLLAGKLIDENLNNPSEETKRAHLLEMLNEFLDGIGHLLTSEQLIFSFYLLHALSNDRIALLTWLCNYATPLLLSDLYSQQSIHSVEGVKWLPTLQSKLLSCQNLDATVELFKEVLPHISREPLRPTSPLQQWHEISLGVRSLFPDPLYVESLTPLIFNRWANQPNRTLIEIHAASAALSYLFSPPTDPSVSLQQWMVNPQAHSFAIHYAHSLLGVVSCDVSEKNADKAIQLIGTCVGNQNPSCFTWVRGLTQQQIDPLTSIAQGSYLPDGLAWELGVRLLKLPLTDSGQLLYNLNQVFAFPDFRERKIEEVLTLLQLCQSLLESLQHDNMLEVQREELDQLYQHLCQIEWNLSPLFVNVRKLTSFDLHTTDPKSPFRIADRIVKTISYMHKTFHHAGLAEIIVAMKAQNIALLARAAIQLKKWKCDSPDLMVLNQKIKLKNELVAVAVSTLFSIKDVKARKQHCLLPLLFKPSRISRFGHETHVVILTPLLLIGTVADLRVLKPKKTHQVVSVRIQNESFVPNGSLPSAKKSKKLPPSSLRPNP